MQDLVCQLLGIETMSNESEAPDKFKSLIKALLKEKFEGEFTFDPIVVIPRIDHEGRSYLHTYIVFDGDQSKLDPHWTLRLSSRVWPQAEELGFDAIPVQSFVEKSEWPKLERQLA